MRRSWEEQISYLVDHMHNYSSKIFMGDFNSDPRSNNSDAEFLPNFASENSLFSKSAFSVIGPYIEQILNSSIRESIFPSVWKKSLVLALN